jgi:bifunctional ADP-heptose synthase (sugar kinase/adenylyltransferase)
MMREKGGEREMNRLDRRNRNPVPAHVEDQIITHLHDIVPHVQGIIVGDQLKERNFGVITDRVREAFADLGRAWPDRVILADARFHIGSFRNVLLKPNRHEAARALYPDWKGSVDIAMAEQCGRALSERCGRPVIVTLSEEGLLVIEGDSVKHIPGVRVPEPTDPVGAGDSATAGIVSSLCAGASLEEAALMGNLVASITVQQLGTTGSASPERVIHRFNEHIGWQDGTAHHG